MLFIFAFKHNINFLLSSIDDASVQRFYLIQIVKLAKVNLNEIRTGELH
jgi:hypothetical protein